MPRAVALVAESSRAKPDRNVLNALLAEVPTAGWPGLAVATAVLAATMGNRLALYDEAAPQELLTCIALVAARDGCR